MVTGTTIGLLDFRYYFSSSYGRRMLVIIAIILSFFDFLFLRTILFRVRILHVPVKIWETIR